MTDPLGRSQVLPYLVGLGARGHRFTLLSCEKPERIAAGIETVEAICREAGIRWVRLPYHRHPPVLSSVYDAAVLRRTARRLHRETPFDLVHCRSYIPGAAGLQLKRKFGVRFLFDMRGFWPDEKVEGGHWNLRHPLFASIYRYFKRLEKKLLRGADHIISLTHEGKRQLLTRGGGLQDQDITVIPCCVDFSHFPLVVARHRSAARTQLGIAPDARVLAYLGSIGLWYMLDEMFDFFRVYGERHADARFLFVTQEEPDHIEAAARRRDVDPDRLIIRPAVREEVPKLMAAADLGIFFIKPVFSKKASSPTKMGEMLALGLPLVTNSGVGDVAEIVEDTGCGIAIDRFDEASYAAAIDRVESFAPRPEEQREKALPWFDVELGIERYDRVYRRLAGI